MEVLHRLRRHVYLDADADNLFASLGKEGALLPLEPVARGAGADIGKVGGCLRREHGHEVMACWWCRIFSRKIVCILCEIDVSEEAGR